MLVLAFVADALNLLYINGLTSAWAGCNTGYAGAHLDEHQHGGRKPTETSVTVFCYKA